MGLLEPAIGVQQQVQPLVGDDPAEEQEPARSAAVGLLNAAPPGIGELAERAAGSDGYPVHVAR